ncbi:hypothetical protein [Pantoea sp. 3_1284]|uniref:hypothetical protein n=1 Tax=Pantoea sp. 3_1284 TaxID=2259618 RepID=UPI000DE41B58|nr:hypothetical protein [Pantoea sp. 3_1284]RBO12815.1 hypothetical protein DSL62_11330 [Pantoea sp. 3_1284]
MISKEKELFDKLLEVYSDALCDVQALSYNDSGKRDFVISDFIGFNFDKVLNCSSVYKKEIKEKSPDALFLAMISCILSSLKKVSLIRKILG